MVESDIFEGLTASSLRKEHGVYCAKIREEYNVKLIKMRQQLQERSNAIIAEIIPIIKQTSKAFTNLRFEIVQNDDLPAIQLVIRKFKEKGFQAHIAEPIYKRSVEDEEFDSAGDSKKFLIIDWS